MPIRLSIFQRIWIIHLFKRKELWRRVANDSSFSNGFRGTALNHMIECDRSIKKVYTKDERIKKCKD